MITEIVLDAVGTFTGTAITLSGLQRINFFYGANGSGKTTISRVIDCIANHASCSITWDKLTPLQAFVYNRDFVDRNFSGDLKGVFTLGEDNLQLKASIESKKNEIATLTSDKQKLASTLNGDTPFSGKLGELSTLKTAFAEKCWEQRVKHESKLASAFKGFMGSKENFRDKLLQEAIGNNGQSLRLDEIEKRAATLFGKNPVPEAVLLPIDGSQATTYATDDALKKGVVGRSDIDIAVMVNMLGISDWVRDGQTHLSKCKPRCPFCQQDAPPGLEAKLNAYFDPSYTDACAAIDRLVVGYEAESKRIKDAVGVLVSNPSLRIDLELLRAHQQALTALLDGNAIKLRDKQKEPSTVATLDSIETALADINGLIAVVTEQIKAHNGMVANLAQDRIALTTAVWRYLWEIELKADLSTFNAKRDAMEKAIASLKKQMTEKGDALKEAERELKELEKKTTSVAPTMKAMSNLLKSFSFTTFTLKEGGTAGTYELVRHNGMPAKETLSDGERTFLTFIYFYHLVKGSHDATGTTTKRVIVVDDPVSSLDSDVLFVVSSLLKNLFADARDYTSNISQVFALTHNIYFHKEMTFDSKRKGETPRADESFWVVRRIGAESRAERCTTNPVKSSYELLWADVRSPNPPQLTICNTLRRIVENYFKLLGGIDPHTLHEKFDGEEKTICRSLVSWINDGSHFGMEDLNLSPSPEAVKKYLDVFRKVFETQKHEGHYRMMMGNAFTERPASISPP